MWGPKKSSYKLGIVIMIFFFSLIKQRQYSIIMKIIDTLKKNKKVLIMIFLESKLSQINKYTFMAMTRARQKKNKEKLKRTFVQPSS